MSTQPKGLYHKFNVTRTDGRHLTDRADSEYFVLDLTHDPHARQALAAYAAACRDQYPELANELTKKVRALAR